MASATERLVDAQRMLLSTSEAIGLKGLEGAGQWLEVNAKAASSLLQASATPLGGRRAAPGSAADATVLARYVPQLLEILAQTNGEIARLLLQQAGELQSLWNEMLSATVGSLSKGSAALPGERAVTRAVMRIAAAPGGSPAGRLDGAAAAGSGAREPGRDASVRAGKRRTRPTD